MWWGYRRLWRHHWQAYRRPEIKAGATVYFQKAISVSRAFLKRDRGPGAFATFRR